MRAKRLRIDHLAFPSFDGDETYRFYTQVMGFRLTSALDGQSEEWGDKNYLMTMFALGDLEVHFFEIEGMKRPRADGLPKDIRHVALSVESRSEIRTWEKRLEAHGVAYWVEDHDGSPSIYFSDPNGVMFEINHHPPERFDERIAAEGLDVLRRWAAARGRRKRMQGPQPEV